MLSSGIVLPVSSDSDWEIIREVLIEQDYDDAIQQAFVSGDCAQIVRIMDLGANVGLFSLRCIDLHLQARNRFRLELFVIEGVPSLSAGLQERFSKCKNENVMLVVKQGLVGRRTGGAMIYSSLSHSCTNSVVQSRAKVSSNPLLDRHAEQSEYIDLGQMIAADITVDLIKCDIEGSELDFLRTYDDLLRRTRFLVIELHPNLCNVDACRELLRTYGFCKLRTIKDEPTHSLHLYRRERTLAY